MQRVTGFPCPCWDSFPSVLLLQKAPLVPAKSSVQARELQSPESPGDPPKAQEKLSLEVLMAEIRSLQILMDLMRVQHQ